MAEFGPVSRRWNAVRHMKALLGISDAYYWHESFAEVLGYSSWADLCNAQYAGDDKLENQLTLLTGPHALTVWKIIQARK